MNIVTAENVQLAFGPREILRGEGFAIQEGEKVGLIGANGAGKSTVLRAMIGQQQLDDGAFHFLKNATVGYLPQDVTELPDKPLFRFVLDAAPGLSDIDRQLIDIEQALEHARTPKEQEGLAATLADLHQRRELYKEKFSEAECETILLGLGFKRTEFQKRLALFSGGWRTRAALAGILFQKPDLLLLDEPTNHLDVPSVTWFDQFLRLMPRACLLVTHDRQFLDRQADRILSFEFEGLRSYTGNYTEYLKLRYDEEHNLFARAKNIEDRKRQAMRFINRFRAKNTKATQVQSRIKELEKLDQVELPKERKKLRFTFKPTPRGGKDVLRIENLKKEFPGVKLFDGLSKTVYRGDRIGIIGVNGAGKTTLLKLLAEELEPDEGQVVIGHNIESSYYAQHQSEKLMMNSSVLSEVWSVVPNSTQTHVRGVCGAFLFSGDDVEKNIGVLSGGEKARVSLAKILLDPGNLLLMDEPTNHLDLWSSEALGEALESYDGTLVFVSHNRGFVNRLADKIWDISDGHIHEFPGNLDEYLYHQKRERAAQDARNEAAGVVSSTAADADLKASSKETKKAQKRAEAELRQQAYRELKPILQKIEVLEKSIAQLETRSAEIEQLLADPGLYEQREKSAELLAEFDKVKQRLDRQLVEWEHLQEKREKVNRELGIEQD